MRATGDIQSISGRLIVTADESRLDLGRARYHAAQEGARESDAEEDYPVYEIGECSAVEFRFWATSSPYRVRMECVRQDPLPQAEDAPAYDTLVLNGRRWWTSAGGRVESGDTAPDELLVGPSGHRWAVYGDEVVTDRADWRSSPGTWGLEVLLQPSRLLETLHRLGAEEAVVESRIVTRIRARPEHDYRFSYEAGGLSVLGADHYLLDVDAATGILLDARAYISGEIAQRHSLSNLRLNAPIPPDLFLPVREDESAL